MFKKGPSSFSLKALVGSLSFCSLTLPIPGALYAKTTIMTDDKTTYTMNFRNISILEYVRFVSKITKVNFIYNEAELAFPVTLVSEQPVSARNLLSAMIQVLEVNGFKVSDQEGSLFITKNPGASQLGELNHQDAPIITRIFKINNINLSTLTALVKSMISQGALVESLQDTHQLIVTDSSKSLDRLAELITELDSSGSNLKMLTYQVKNQSASALNDVMKQIIAPFQGSSPYIAIPQIAQNQLLVVTTPYLLQKTEEALIAIDVPNAAMPIDSGSSNLYLYNPQYKKASDLKVSLEQLVRTLEADGPATAPLVSMIRSMKLPEGSLSLIFIGPPNVWPKMHELLMSMDTKEASSNLYIYRILHLDYLTLKDLLDETASQVEKIGDPDRLAETIDSMNYIQQTNSLVFHGSPEAIIKLQMLLPSLDVDRGSNNDILIYHPSYLDQTQLLKTLENIADSLKDASDLNLARCIKNAKWMSDTHAYVFRSDAATLARIKVILTEVDNPSSDSLEAGSTFQIYELKYASGDFVIQELNNMEPHLAKSNSSSSLIHTIQTIKWLQNNNSLLISGTKSSIRRVFDLINKIDIPSAETLSESKDTFVLYPLKEGSGEVITDQLHGMAESLPGNSPQDLAMRKALRSVKYMPDTNSILITGSKETISFVESLITTIDLKSASDSQANFYLYKLQNVPGSKVIDQIQHMAKKLPSESTQDKNVLRSISKLEWIQDTNSILIAGNQATVDRISALVAQFDSTQGVRSDNKGEFLVYSPHYKNLEELDETLQEYAVALKQSGLVDPNLLETINTAKQVPSANQLVFTGNTESISKLKTLLSLIDQAGQLSSIQQLGQSTFFVYQLKNMSADQFTNLMHNFEGNLSKSGASDPALAKCIDTMQVIKETNSVLFTGPAATLDRIAQIASKIDIGGAGGETTYEIYTPHYVSGDELIGQMCQFAQGLLESGIQDQSLYDAINNIRWIEKSNTLIITGSTDTLTKVQDLLARLDIPGGNKESLVNVTSGFMVYKLQYHSGSEIQQALNKLAPTFAANGPNPNPALASAISSMQWIQMTNSLVASGDQDHLEKLKTLISEIDCPLKQVFIEVLVIETDVVNTQNFGLQWFGKGQLMNRLGFGGGNFGAGNPLTQSNAMPPFATSANAVTSTTPPNAQSIPFFGNTSSTGGNSGAGFDLGVIGDIIMHKGQSFFSLGSLVNALQADQDTTIVMNPKIVAQDNNNSTIFIGQNIPFLGSTVSNQSNSTLTTNNIEYRDVGTNLSITPKLGDDNVITLEITYNMSAQTQNTVATAGSQFAGVQTTQTNMTTRVHVPDQHFVVLSGMLQDQKQVYKTGIPCLGGLPIIGLAFSDTERTAQKNNIMIFIRPTIIHSFDQFKEVTENQENVYRGMLERTPDKENFDAGLNLVKTPEDE